MKNKLKTTNWPSVKDIIVLLFYIQKYQNCWHKDILMI